MAPLMTRYPTTKCANYTSLERYSLLTWWLATGARMTSTEAAHRLGIKPGEARGILDRMSRVLPLYCDDDGYWTMLNGEGNDLAS